MGERAMSAKNSAEAEAAYKEMSFLMFGKELKFYMECHGPNLIKLFTAVI
jgi:hypothetical protein